MNSFIKKIFSILLVLMILISLLPASTLAVNDDEVTQTEPMPVDTESNDSDNIEEPDNSDEPENYVFTVLFADTCIANQDFEADYEEMLESDTEDSPLTASLDNPVVYDNIDEAGNELLNCFLNFDKGYLITKLYGVKSSQRGEIAEETNNGYIEIKYRTYTEPTKESVESLEFEIINNAIQHDYNNPKYGDYLFRGRMVGCGAGCSWRKDDDGYLLDLNFVPYMTSTVEQEAEADTRYADVLSSLNLTDDLIIAEKIKKIYDWICSNISYNNSPYDYETYDANVHSAYRGIVENNCVCQGFATVFYRMCLEAGIDARSVGVGSGHEWNIVEIDNKYYFLDSTWDRNYTTLSRKYFLRGLSWWSLNHDNYSPGALSRAYPNNDGIGYILCTDEYDVSDSDYSWPYDVPYSGSCGDNLTWRLYSDGLLTISGTGGMYDYSNPPWYPCASEINTVIINPGVTAIGKLAFRGCSNLTSVFLSDSVEEISQYAFYNCTGQSDIYYSGNGSQWNKISINNTGNGYITNAKKHFESSYFTIQYDANGGNYSPLNQIKFKETSLDLRFIFPSRLGYTFLGWATGSEATQAEYQPGDAFTVDEDTTLYAVWTESEILTSVAEDATINNEPIDNASEKAILAAVELSHNSQMSETNISDIVEDARMLYQLMSIEGTETDESFDMLSVRFDVKPVKIYTDEYGQITITEVVDNSLLTEDVIFRLPVPSSMTGEYVTISHFEDGSDEADWSFPYIIQGSGTERYVEITVQSFSEFLMEQNSNAAWNVTTTEQYTTLSDALTDAESGETVQLLADISDEQFVVVESGVTLDLFGYNITGARMFYVTGQVTDSVTARGYVTSSGWMFGTEQEYTPVYDAVNSGYQFVLLKFFSQSAMSGDSYVFALGESSRNRLYPLFDNNPDYCKSFKAFLDLAWTSGDTEITKSFRYADSFMKKVVDSAKTPPLLGFKATISGVTGTATVTPKFVAYDSTGTVEMFTLYGPTYITTDSGETWTKV